MALTLAVTAALAGAARADVTVGAVTPAAGASPQDCSTGTLLATNTAAPSGLENLPPGQLTSWKVNTVGATSGDPVTLVVMRKSGTTYRVEAVDQRALPSPLPASGVATFAVSPPIVLTGGEVLSVYTDGYLTACAFSGGTTPAADTLVAVLVPSAPVAGQVLSEALGGVSPGGWMQNLQATISTDLDAQVTTTAGPANVGTGSLALLSSTVTNRSLVSGTVRFIDPVPAGLRIVAAAAGAGPCTVVSQVVTCTLDLDASQATPVVVVVTATAARSYTNTVVVAGTQADPVPGNNSASATLTVAAPPARQAPPAPLAPPVLAPPPGSGPPPTARPSCLVPKLKATPLVVARPVLRLLHCKVGRVKRARSRRVRKGLVVKTSLKPGTYAGGRVVGLTVSTGPKRKSAKRKTKATPRKHTSKRPAAKRS
ncbi:MAG: hypothetical protein AB7G37_08320 [Solirubrobacteraceae bacterium]